MKATLNPDGTITLTTDAVSFGAIKDAIDLEFHRALKEDRIHKLALINASHAIGAELDKHYEWLSEGVSR